MTKKIYQSRAMKNYHICEKIEKEMAILVKGIKYGEIGFKDIQSCKDITKKIEIYNLYKSNDTTHQNVVIMSNLINYLNQSLI